MRTSELKGGGNVTVLSFQCACGCRAPGTLRLFCGCCVPGYTDTCPPFPFPLVTLADAMRSLDVSRIARNWQSTHHVTSDVSASHDSGSLTRMFPIFVSRDSYCTCMCHGDPPRPFLCHAYIFSLMPFTRLSWTLLRPLVSRTICSPVLVTPSPLSDFLPLPDWTLFLSYTFTDSTPVCTCIVPTCIYTGLEMG